MGDDGDVCALCCTKFDPEKMSMCDKCELQFMAFPDVHDVFYVKGRWLATFLSWGSLGHLILRAFPRGVLGGSSGGT